MTKTATMQIPLVDLKAQYGTIRDEVHAAMQRVLDTTAFIQGPDVREFEKEFAAFCRAGHAIGVASGTDALHLVLKAMNVGAGDEVITTPFTFIATAEAISMCGARPVFVDIDPRTYNIDPAQVEAAITPKTKVLMPVHLYGQPADIDPLLDIAHNHKLRVIEDAAQAHGAEYKARRVGTLADAACFSFYPGKNLGAYGDAGAVVTNDAELADAVRMLRDHGRRDKYEHLIPGYGSRLDTLHAAILRAKLPHLEQWNARRKAIAARYDELLANANVERPHRPDWADPVYHLYVVRVRNRAAVQEALKAEGIATGVHYPIPLHVQPAYKSLGYEQGAFPESEKAASEVLSLPIYPELGDDDVERVAEALKKAVA
jgi:dTDP-4-amino-4,6-dideoxygalactose transaminase